MTNRPIGTLYVGVTDNLSRRAWEHRAGLGEGFTKQYSLRRLELAEYYDDMRTARQREREYEALAALLESATDSNKIPIGTTFTIGSRSRGWPRQARPRDLWLSMDRWRQPVSLNRTAVARGRS
jgi:hypothetical protein